MHQFSEIDFSQLWELSALCTQYYMTPTLHLERDNGHPELKLACDVTLSIVRSLGRGHHCQYKQRVPGLTDRAFGYAF